MAEIVLRAMLPDAGLAEQVEVDSAGTGDWHVGDPADRRTVAALAKAGYDGSQHVARQLDPSYLQTRDLILVADNGHLHDVLRMAGADSTARIQLLREFDPEAVAADALEVDDPYYGNASDFDRCLAQVEAACAGVVEELKRELR